MVCIYNGSDHWPHRLTVVQRFLGTTRPKHGRQFTHGPAPRLAQPVPRANRWGPAAIWDAANIGHRRHMPVHMPLRIDTAFSRRETPLVMMEISKKGRPFNFIKGEGNLDGTPPDLRGRLALAPRGGLTGRMTCRVEASETKNWGYFDDGI